MKVYLAKDLNNLTMYGDTPDLTLSGSPIVESFCISDVEYSYLDKHFIDETNDACNALLDLGDYQFYNDYQCQLLLDWINSNDSNCAELKSFYEQLKNYLKYAIDNHTGIAIEL
jgi:hypothetical protein